MKNLVYDYKDLELQEDDNEEKEMIVQALKEGVYVKN